MATELSLRGRTTYRGRPRWRRAVRTLVAMVAAVSVLSVPELAEASITEVNQQRAAAGLPPVSEDPALTSLAQQKAAQMAASSSLTHTGNLGGAVGSVMPGFTAAAENIGYGRSVSSLTNTFMASPTHRSAILGNFNTAGVGIVVGGDGRVWITQVFARVGGTTRVAPAVRNAAVGGTSGRRYVRSRGRRYVSSRRKCRFVRGRKRCRYVRSRSRGSVRHSARHRHVYRQRHVHRYRHVHRNGRVHLHRHVHRHR